MSDENPDNQNHSQEEQLSSEEPKEGKPEEHPSPDSTPLNEIKTERENVATPSLEGQISPVQSAPPAEENWEAALDEKLTEAERKRRKKEENRKKRAEKQRLMQERTAEIIEQQFAKVFDPKIVAYTVIFTALAILIAILTRYKEQLGPTAQLYQIYLVISFIIAFVVLLQLSRIPTVSNYLFSPKKADPVKIVILAATVVIGVGVCLLYQKYIDPTLTEEVKYFRFQQFFEMILAVVFWGWNIIQIWFLKTSLENASLNIEARFQVAQELKPFKTTQRTSGIFNIILILIPFIFHIVFISLYVIYDTREPYENFFNFIGQEVPDQLSVEKFTPIVFYFSEFLASKYPGQEFTTSQTWQIFFTEYIPEVWWANPALKGIIVWNAFIIGLLIFTALRQFDLYRKSVANKTPNIFSPFFYLLLWLITWIKAFLIIKNYIASLESVEMNLQWYDTLFDHFTSILLMLFTIVNMLRGFSIKIRKLSTERHWINEYNMMFLLFILVLSYWGGQWIIITGESFPNKHSLDMAVNLVVVTVNMVFYYWFSNWVLERRGFIRKTTFTVAETRLLMIELSQNIKGNLLQTIENKEIIMSSLNKFMLTKKIALESPGKTGEGVVETLEEKEDVLNSHEKLERCQDAVKDAKIEQDQYDAALKRLEELKATLITLNTQRDNAAQAVNSLPTDLETQLAEWSEKKRVIGDKVMDKQQAEVTAQQHPDQLVLAAQLNAELTQLFAEQKEITTKWLSAKENLDDGNRKRKTLADLENSIIETQKAIQALETDLISLKERAEEAKPLLDATEITVISAKDEVELTTKFEEAKTTEKVEGEKLIKAKELVERANNDLRVAEASLATTKSIDENQNDINVAITKIGGLEQKIKEAQTQLDERAKIATEKLTLLDTAKSNLMMAQQELAPFEKDLAAAKNGLENANVYYKKGLALKQELEVATKNLEKAGMDKGLGPDYNQSDIKLKTTQGQLKDAKTKLKDLKKQDPGDGSLNARISEAVQSVNVLEGEESKYKQLVRDAKALRDALDEAEKQVARLKEQQINLNEAQGSIKQAEETLKNCDEKVKAPREKVQDCQKKLDFAQSEYNSADGERNNATKNLSLLQIDLKTTQREKAGAEQSLEQRKAAEKVVVDVNTLIKEREKILAKATDNSNKFENLRHEAEKAANIAIEDAKLDWDVHLAHKALKKAHKTFKEAIRSAEANVKACESTVASAIKNREETIAKRTQVQA